jgi:hypothetical protein
VIAFKIFRVDAAPEAPLTDAKETITDTQEAPMNNIVNLNMLVAVESVLAKLCAIRLSLDT